MPTSSYDKGYAAFHNAAAENQALIDKMLANLGVADDAELDEMSAEILAKPTRWQRFKLIVRCLVDRQFGAGYKAAIRDQLDRASAAIEQAMPQLNAIYAGTDDAELKSIINMLTSLADQADAQFRDLSGL